jgi:PTH2 family peptidyl-tRNA hydrolase
MWIAIISLLFGLLLGYFLSLRSQAKAITAQPLPSQGQSSPKEICALVVRSDLKMGKGKTAAQCCHASLGLWTETHAQGWADNDYPHLLYKANSEDQLHAIAKQAQAEKVNWYLVADAGRTQIDPGSKTVLGVGPCTREKLEKVTSDLQPF